MKKKKNSRKLVLKFEKVLMKRINDLAYVKGDSMQGLVIAMLRRFIEQMEQEYLDRYLHERTNNN